MAGAEHANNPFADDAEATYFAESEEFFRLEAQMIENVESNFGEVLANAALAEAGQPHALPSLEILDEGDEFLDPKNGPAVRLRSILEKYREMPQLLDPCLEKIIQPTIEYIRDAMQKIEGLKLLPFRNAACIALFPLYRFLYRVCNVRGFKTVVKFFTHEAADLEPTLYHLLMIPDDYKLWSCRYILILWLSLIVMIPFNLSTIDSNAVDSDGKPEKGIAQRLIDLGNSYLGKSGVEYQAASVLLARLLTRKDTVNEHLPAYLEWCSKALQDESNAMNYMTILHTLCQIHKLGPREFLYPHLDSLLSICSKVISSSIGLRNPLIRKLATKLCQRVGLCYLKPKIASWRYNRGNRSLSKNLQGAISQMETNIPSVTKPIVQEDESEELVPEQIEEVVDILLRGLKDTDTIVRWSAAKGVGRIASRLTQELASFIVESVKGFLADDVYGLPEDGIVDIREADKIDLSGASDHGWHGACLALAELARRGLLLPDSLEEIMPWIIIALRFDIRKGSYSIGTQVRDAACYVCWSFARAYDPTVLRPYLPFLSRRLAVASCLDREVNVRRAASAALQECVGRLGTAGDDDGLDVSLGVPNGIDVITLADYFAVGKRSVAALEVAVKLAEFKAYRPDVVKHVAMTMTVHWDKEIRDLGSKCLAKLAVLDPKSIVETYLGSLLEQSTHPDLVLRHGGILAVAELTLAVSKIENGFELHLKPYAEKISKLVLNYPASFLESFGSDLTVSGLCHFIKCLSEADWAILDGCDHIKSWNDLLDGCLDRREEMVGKAASLAYASFLPYRLRSAKPGSATHQQVYENVVSLSLRTDPKEETAIVNGAFRRRGATWALQALPISVLAHEFGGEACAVPLLKSLNVILGQTPTGAEAEIRKSAVLAFAGVLGKLLDAGCVGVLPEDMLDETCLLLLRCVEDYSADQRGDVGSWVREACFRAWATILEAALNPKSGQAQGWSLPQNYIPMVILKLIRQSVEKIDRVRESASQTLTGILVFKEKLKAAAPGDDKFGEAIDSLHETLHRPGVIVNWLNPGEVYPLMVPLLKAAFLRRDLLLGLVVSVGGISESLVRQSTSSFVSFANSLPEKAGNGLTLHGLLDAFTSLFLEENLPMGKETRERVSASLIEVTDVLIGSGAVTKAVESGWTENGVGVLFDRVKKEVFKSKDVKKVVAAIKVFGGLSSLQADAVRVTREKSLSAAVNYLAHPFPRVRRAASEAVFLVISTTEHEGDDAEKEAAYAEAEDILLSSDWDLPVASLKPIRQQVADLLNVKLPVTTAATGAAATRKNT
ncbi:hypothetical protein HDU97_008816 [Phlyctochytrium planicorne]|nr:hypothetical protein HDU97_008816 [Phlyctochytrium planicorne]